MDHSLLLLHVGPWHHAGGFSDGGWGPPFGFFPFFPLLPGLFWLGILFFVLARINQRRWQHRGGATPPPPRPLASDGLTEPTWPNLDPPSPPTAPRRDEGKVEYF